MSITFVMAVYNKLELTKNCYKHLRNVYPTAPLVISDGGSTDGTIEWLQSINDENFSYTHKTYGVQISFSDTYNLGIENVKTEKCVLIHNDMIIGKHFLENLDKLSDKNTILSYTTIEPPIFVNHNRPGKVLLNLGSSFDDFNFDLFNQYVEKNKDNNNLYDGSVFFMCVHVSTFKEIGMFDGKTYFPAFCEDDDFLIRAKIHGCNLKTVESAIVYHFVSQTSRFSEAFKDKKYEIELNSNKNFIRKWGTPISIFHQIKYWEINSFSYIPQKLYINLKSEHLINYIEPFFDLISMKRIPFDYILSEKKSFLSLKHESIENKFTLNSFHDLQIEDVILVEEINELTPNDLQMLNYLQLKYQNIPKGIEYVEGNFKITKH